MTNSFYNIAAVRSELVTDSEELLSVNLDRMQVIENDSDFLNFKKNDYKFWASGGGSFLINNRYIPVLKRSSIAEVNSDMISIFSGRANSLEELLDPSQLKRELFEELEFFHSGQRVLFSSLLERDEVYIKQKKKLLESHSIILNDSVVEEVKLKSRKVELSHAGKKLCFNLSIEAVNNCDYNVYFLLNCELQELDFFSGIGTEDQVEREVFLYDLIDKKLRIFTPNERSNWRSHSEFSFSNNFTNFIKLVEESMKNENHRRNVPKS